MDPCHTEQTLHHTFYDLFLNLINHISSLVKTKGMKIAFTSTIKDKSINKMKSLKVAQVKDEMDGDEDDGCDL